MSDDRYVIVGGGLAGGKAAETLRAEGFTGDIVLISEEEHLPYERPPLSKQYLRGEKPREAAYVNGEEYYRENDIELRTGSEVSAVDTAARKVSLRGGETLAYDRLLIATGAEPIRPPIPGADLDGVLYLRSFEDSDRLRQGIQSASRVVVIGAGWIGSEVAASARQLGREVSLVEMSQVPLERVLGPEAGRLFLELHADHGVDLHMGATVTEIVGSGSVEGVRTGDGVLIPGDLVLIGVGVRPRTGLAEAAGLAVDDGITTDDQLRTSVPDVFAAGDVANAFHPLYGRRLRVEHWSNARHQGTTAAKNMLGQAVSYDRIPYFYSDQYDLGMEYSGLASADDPVVFRGDREGREVIVFWTRDRKVVAGMNVNVWDVVEPIQALIRSGVEVDPERLADPDVPLEELAGAG